MDIVAIIPARCGSKGVPHKNIRPLCGFPLLAWSIAASLNVKRIDRTILSTDSEDYAAIGKQFGAEVPFLRPAEFATSNSTDREFFLHAINWFQANEGHTPTLFVHLRPTTPLRDPSVIEFAIETFLQDPTATSLRSAHPASESPAKWFCEDEDGYFKGLMGNEWLNLPRQKCPIAYIPDGYVDIVRTSTIVAREDFYFPNMRAFVVPHASEVDTVEDFDYIEYQARRGHCLLDILNNLSK